MMKKLIYILLMMICATGFSQVELSLTDCYSLAEINHPIAKQNELIPQQNELNTEIINTKKYPEIDFSAQASYQSDVIKIPEGDFELFFDIPNKDQYRTTLTLNQLIYAGGSIKAAIEDENAKSKTQQQFVDVELYQLKPKINQLYFSILLLQEKKELLLSKQHQLKEKINEVKAGVKYGSLLPSSDSVLEAELLKLDQQLTEIESSKLNLIQSLEKYLGIEITEATIFVYPEISDNLSSSSSRPEIDLFNLRKDQVNYTSSILSKNKLPKLYGFAQGGYGNPGLDPLDNSFQTFYVVGLKLDWNVFDWNKIKKQTQALEINKQFIETEKEKFELNNSMQLDQQRIEIHKYKEFINTDKSIIDLQKQILKTADSQLNNGVITSSIYMDKLTDLYEAENNLRTHEIQLLLAQSNFKVIQGI